MIPILVSLIAAVLFSVAVAAVYGFDALSHYPWVDMVLVALILGGALVTLVSRVGRRTRCLACSFLRQLPGLDALCSRFAPCGHPQV